MLCAHIVPSAVLLRRSGLTSAMVSFFNGRAWDVVLYSHAAGGVWQCTEAVVLHRRGRWYTGARPTFHAAQDGPHCCNIQPWCVRSSRSCQKSLFLCCGTVLNLCMAGCCDAGRGLIVSAMSAVWRGAMQCCVCPPGSVGGWPASPVGDAEARTARTCLLFAAGEESVGDGIWIRAC